MITQLTQRQHHETSQRNVAGVVDISGYGIFSTGDLGQAHAMAHDLFDRGMSRQGHRLLGRWLDSRIGQGSDWVHLQFHVALFELALGEWDKAHQRFLTEVLPTAATSGEALTDAPALLWRLAMTAPAQVELPWQPLRASALAHIRPDDDGFIQIHHLLALAGAGDTRSIRHWIRTSSASQILRRFGEACEALSRAAYRQAGELLWKLLPEIPQVGGSHAQNGIFKQLAGWASRQAEAQPAYLNAA